MEVIDRDIAEAVLAGVLRQFRDKAVLLRAFDGRKHGSTGRRIDPILIAGRDLMQPLQQ